MSSYGIHFFQYAPSDIDSVYVELSDNLVLKHLYLGKSTERKPYQGFINSLTSNELQHQLPEILSRFTSAHRKYLIINSLYYTVVPEKFFNVDDKEKYLNLLTPSKPYEESVVFCDYWSVPKLYLVYRIPQLVSQLLKQSSYFNCYHIQTAINYITYKKSFVTAPNYTTVFVDKDKVYFIGGTKNRILFVQSYTIQSYADINYYFSFLVNKFFVQQANIQVTLFAPDIKDLEFVIHFLKNDYPNFQRHVFSVQKLRTLYRITKPPLFTEDLYLLLLLSICES